MAEPKASDTTAPAGTGAGIAALITVTIAWAVPPLVIKESTLPPITFGAWRLWAGVAIYAAILLATRKPLPIATIKRCAPGGLIFAVDMALAFSAFRLTSVANATLIGSVATVTIILGAAVWFGERMRRSDAIFVAVSMGGVALVVFGSSAAGASDPLGDALAALSIFSWTAYWLFSKRARTGIGPLEYMTAVMLVAAVAVSIAAPIIDGPQPLPSGAELVGVVLVAFLAGTIGHSLLAWSHSHVRAWLGALIIQTVPLVSGLLAWAVLGETVGPITFVGGAILFGATGALVVRTMRRTPPKVADPLESEDATLPSA